jgi:hypothetical protein
MHLQRQALTRQDRDALYLVGWFIQQNFVLAPRALADFHRILGKAGGKGGRILSAWGSNANKKAALLPPLKKSLQIFE